MIFYRFVQWLVRTLRPLVCRLEIEGMGNIPDRGPFLLVCNHQSYLDPILIESIVRRRLYTMAKSTLFNYPLLGAILKGLKTYPVRRYEVDPQAVRLALMYLERGEGVAIYIEGERSWDLRLQEPRRGTLRLILKAGVPVIPCGISGAYDMWPRWDRALRRGNVRIRFGQPLRFPQLDDRDKRERALPEVRQTVMSALAGVADAEWGGT